MTLRNLSKHCVPQFSHLCNGEDKNLQWTVLRCNELEYMEGLG